MGLTTKGQKTEGTQQEFVNKYLEYGFNEAAIMGYDIRTASTGSIQVSLHMESPVDDPKFEGVNWRQSDKDAPEVKATGKYNSVKLGIYIKEDNESQVQRILAGLGAFADACGRRKEVDEINVSTLNEYLKEYVEIVKGILFWSKFKAEEYEPGKYNLSFGEYKAQDGNWYVIAKSIKEVVKCETIEKEPLKQELIYMKGDETKKFRFDKTSKWDYKLADKSDTQEDTKEEIGDLDI